MEKKEKHKELEKKLSDFLESDDVDRISKNLEEQGLIAINPESPNEARLTQKGFSEVMRWKEKYPDMDFLLFLFNETGERLKKMGVV